MDHFSPSIGYIVTGKEKKVNLRYILAFHFAPSAALPLSLSPSLVVPLLRRRTEEEEEEKKTSFMKKLA